MILGSTVLRTVSVGWCQQMLPKYAINSQDWLTPEQSELGTGKSELNIIQIGHDSAAGPTIHI